MAVDTQALLESLDPEQRQVALAARGPVCVLAGAGTGKTRAITHRIAYASCIGVMNPAHTLALTFTVRAAGELRGRLRELGAGAETVRASTFHAAALRQLTYFWPRVIGGRPPKLIESKLPLLREAAAELKLRKESAALADAAAEIEWAKASQIRPDGYPSAASADGRSPSWGPEQVGRLFEAYERLRRERQLIDFESVLELTAALVYAEPTVARQVHETFRHFTVDEYQDVSPLQKLLLDAWVGDRDDVCVVGDPQQTIYTFAGASSEHLRSFGMEFPGATVVRLVRDYRSTPQVVAAANRLTLRAGAELIAQRETGPDPVFAEYPDDAAEAGAVAARIQGLAAAGVAYRGISILVRINAQTMRFEQALADAGIPYVVRGAERFYERPEVRKALVLLRGAARAAVDGTETELPQGDDTLLPRGEMHPRGDDPPGSPRSRGASPSPRTPRGTPAGPRTRVQGETLLTQQVRHVLATAGLTAVPPAAGGKTRERWESLSAIAQLAEDLEGMPLEAFAAELSRRAELGHAPVPDAVTLASMHSAKGLEWDAVILPSLTEGIMPIGYARAPEAIDEERRLLYVAVTRARKHLALSWSQASGKPSRFLAELRRGEGVR
jgi:DNA helicase-2/ATP-dependent DNA helicase PcrA